MIETRRQRAEREAVLSRVADANLALRAFAVGRQAHADVWPEIISWLNTCG